MSKEGDLKLIDLKVSVHCCDGCKKKVKKALQAIEGVVRTEIHSSQPRVTVEVRMVEPRTLIKKLAKIGKPAELWTNGGGADQPKGENTKEKSKGGNNEGNSKAAPESKDGKSKSAEGNEKPSSKCEEGDKSKKNETSGNGGAEKGGKKGEKEAKDGAASSNNALPEVTKTVNPSPGDDCTIKPGIVHLGNTGPYNPYPYTVAPPPPVPQLCYMVTAYSAPPMYLVQDPRYAELQVSHQHTQPAVPVFNDYFDDENTVGCSIM